jgi:hypothetical protein
MDRRVVDPRGSERNLPKKSPRGKKEHPKQEESIGVPAVKGKGTGEGTL